MMDTHLLRQELCSASDVALGSLAHFSCDPWKSYWCAFGVVLVGWSVFSFLFWDINWKLKWNYYKMLCNAGKKCILLSYGKHQKGVQSLKQIFIKHFLVYQLCYSISTLNVVFSFIAPTWEVTSVRCCLGVVVAAELLFKRHWFATWEGLPA